MSEISPALKAPKHRSPSYPAYDLESALQRATQLHALAKTHRANVATLIGQWGYSPKSSKGLLMLATLKKFGLAEDQGKGDARTMLLTPLGRELVYYDSDRTSDEWKARAQVAAMTPTIHRELWQRYEGHLPTDSVMKDYLVLQARFSESAAVEVLGEFRRTLTFAGIGSSDGPDIVENSEEEDTGEQDQNVTVPATPQVLVTPAHVWPPAAPEPVNLSEPANLGDTGQRQKRSAPLPVNVNLSDDGWATLQVSGRLTTAQWDQLMAVLNAMKPGLTT